MRRRRILAASRQGDRWPEGATRVATGRLSQRTIVYTPPRHTSGRRRSMVISASFLQIARKNRQMMTLTTSGVNHHFVTYTNDLRNDRVGVRQTQNISIGHPPIQLSPLSLDDWLRPLLAALCGTRYDTPSVEEPHTNVSQGGEFSVVLAR